MNWIEENWKTVLLWIGGILAVVAITLTWMQVSKSRAEKSRQVLADGMRLYTAATSEDGDATMAEATAQLEEASRLGGGSAPGQVARYYLGLAKLEEGDSAAAAENLQGVVDEAEEPLLRQGASMALARARAATGDLDEAERVLRGVASETAAMYSGDQALLLLAKLRADNGDAEGSRVVLREILDTYPDRPGSREARRRLDRN